MNSCWIQRNTFATRRDEMGRSSITVPVSDRRETVACPKPRRVGVLNSFNDHRPVRSLRSQLSHRSELCGSDPDSDLLDIILLKGCPEEIASPPRFFTGSPPCRVANPLTQDSRFGDGLFFAPSPPLPLPSALPPSSPSSGRTGSCVRANFGNNPGVRIVGFDCLDRDRRSIPALA
ncbi:PREDICTED: uncharacterized protein LOC104825699 isoform X2 [Tarenaya hassleriana]|uniref:uncharacterized protein LOC104825699 isoform X2 n=1 Tax=Tarenaya hassleriana TaxID=28532 RepID=UPI0008FD85FB|nr:PREDICTED: uncharacterized protein LOC104825699 isoform X2 [Tarenaya hassleriana]